MVEFCGNCNSSLPRADLTVARGEIFLSHDYVCPFCKEPASGRNVESKDLPLPSENKDVVVSDGKAAETEPMKEPA